MAKTVRLLAPYRHHGQPHYRQGEIATFGDSEADLLITRGWAEPYAAAAPSSLPPPPTPDKALPAPPKDKMIRGPRIGKEWRKA